MRKFSLSYLTLFFTDLGLRTFAPVISDGKFQTFFVDNQKKSKSFSKSFDRRLPEKDCFEHTW